ncbi:MAG: hypothetical protein V3S39_08620, partial [Thermodesulfobacteriota bacterium]
MWFLEVLRNLSIVAAALTAIYGINAWRRELRGKKQYELAEEVLVLFYEARDKVRAIRNPFGREDEGQNRKSKPNETEQQMKVLDQAYVIVERYEKNERVFNRLHALRYRFMALFGPEKAEPFDELNQILKEILISAHMLGIFWWREDFEG